MSDGNNIVEPSLEMLGSDAYNFTEEEEYMSDKMMLYFRALLMVMRSQIAKSIDRAKSDIKEITIHFPDNTDVAKQVEILRLELWLRNRGYSLLHKIEDSLKLIYNHEYGYCGLCGIEIGVKRLEAQLTANLCVDCQTIEEFRIKQTQMTADVDIYNTDKPSISELY